MKSEREKMLAGELYDPLDPELVAARTRARHACQALNATREGDSDQRRHILRDLFGAGGDTVWMQPPFYCDYGRNIELGERVFFNFNCVVLDVCPVRIGSFTLFGPAVQIYTASHPLDAELRRRMELGKPVEIGSDVWVGGGAIILPGVRIGSRAVIGAGSVVTGDIPDGALAAGNPCRVIRQLDRGCTLRPATDGDAEAVAAIWLNGWREAHLGRIPDALLAARTPESFGIRAAQRVADTVVAEAAGQVAGFVMVVRDEVEQVYVSPAHRGTGVAGSLLAEALRLIAAAGHRQAWLAVVAGNTRARRFYEKSGWTDEGPFDYAAAIEGGTILVPCHRYVTLV